MKADDIHITGSQQNIQQSDLVDFIKNQLNTFLYSQIEGRSQNRNNPDKIFYTNIDFWKSILANECHSEQIVKLQKFHLTEWIPIAPGLFHTYEAEQSRKAAQRNALYHNKRTFQSKLQLAINADLRWNNEIFDRILKSFGDKFFGKLFLEYNPDGKESMLKGGIGSLRLANKFINGRECYILGASSTGVSHEGIPLIVETYLYQETISKIKDNGGFVVSIIGRLKVIPKELSLIRSYREIPRYCLYVENIEFFTPSNKEDLHSSAVISYYRANHIFNQSVSFCYFSPEKNDEGLKKAVIWLEDYASRYSNSNSFIIEGDFDEYITHFDKVDFPLNEISNGRISKETLLKYKNFFHFEINETVMNNNFENIINSTVIVNSNNVSISLAQDNSIPNSNPVILSQFKKDIQNIIAKGKLGKSLTLLISHFKNVGNKEARNETILYNSQYSELRKQENLDTISREEANRIKSRITMALIELVDDNL